MHFRMMFLLALTTSCSQKSDTQSVGIIGNKLEDSTSLYNAYGFPPESLFLVDKPTSRILEVNVNTMTLNKSFPLSKPSYEHTLASSLDGSYVVDFSTKHLEVIRSDGSREDRPFSFQGTPVSAAYNPKKGILAMQDDLQSIGLLMFSEAGAVLKSWLGGSLIEKDKSLLAGDIDSSGRLVLAVSDKSIAIVDVEKTMTALAWSSESFATDIDLISWLAPDSEVSNLSLVLAKDAIAVVDVEAKTVVKKIALTDSKLTIFGKSKLVKPHVLVFNSASNRREVYYISKDGTLTSHELPQSDLDMYAVSYLDAAGSELSILSSKENVHRVLKLRLSDNLMVLDESFTSIGEAQLGTDMLLIDKKSKLGYLQSYDFNSNATKELKGYNFDYLRSN